jgi:hypothetical protein
VACGVHASRRREAHRPLPRTWPHRTPGAKGPLVSRTTTSTRMAGVLVENCGCPSGAASADAVPTAEAHRRPAHIAMTTSDVQPCAMIRKCLLSTNRRYASPEYASFRFSNRPDRGRSANGKDSFRSGRRVSRVRVSACRVSGAPRETGDFHPSPPVRSHRTGPRQRCEHGSW